MKKIIVSLIAANIAVLAFVFSITPKEAKAAPDYKWDGEPLDCLTNPPTYTQECWPSNKLVVCVEFPCLQFLEEVTIR